MKRSTKLQFLRLLLVFAVFGIFASFTAYPGFVVPGLLLVLALLYVGGRLWRAYSAAIVAEYRAERESL